METKLEAVSAQFSAALEDFKAALEIDVSSFDELTADVIKNGQVQKFEFTIELLWKLLKVFLFERHGVDAPSPKQAVRRYFELGFCEYEESEGLLEAVDLRNMLSHVYKKETFEEIYRQIETYSGLFTRVFQKKPW